MATAHLTKESICGVISTHIQEVFDKILSLVKNRRDKLLAEVDDIRQEIEVKNVNVVESLKELEGLKNQLTDMVVKQNNVMNQQQESIAQIDEEIRILKLSLRESKLKFNYSLEHLMQDITGFGEIFAEYQYSSELSATRVIDRYEDTSFGRVNSVHIDNVRELLYVVCSDLDRMRHPVTVFNANDFQFIQEFGNIENPPNCFSLSRDFVYTASVNWNVLLQYIPLNGCVVKTNSVPNDNRIFDISINSDNQLFVLVLCEKKFKILTYDKELSFKKEINIKIDLPWCYYHHLSMCILNGIFYISYNYERLLLFNGEGKLTNSFFKNEGESQIKTLKCFCSDEADNIVVVDSSLNSVKVFSKEGEFIRKLGDKTESDSLRGVNDITVYKGTIILSCDCTNEDTWSGIVKIY